MGAFGPRPSVLGSGWFKESPSVLKIAARYSAHPYLVKQHRRPARDGAADAALLQTSLPARTITMLGPPKTRQRDELVLTSLERRLPASNFYRHLDATLDLRFVRDGVGDTYAERGRPSIDPVVFFKLQLILFFAGRRSERTRIETADLPVAHRWYLGYGFEEPLPDHSSLTRIRSRLGLTVCTRFFARVVECCQDAGLVWGKALLFDATKVRANADVDSRVPRFSQRAQAHLDELFAGEAQQPVEPAATTAPVDAGEQFATAPSQPDAIPAPDNARRSRHADTDRATIPRHPGAAAAARGGEPRHLEAPGRTPPRPGAAAA
jgi:transposase